MLENNQTNVDANISSVSRRSVLKAAAWSLPAIAVASAVPALAASLLPPTEDQCVITQGGPWTFDGTLSSNGNTGASPTTDGNFGTGWLPAIAPGFNNDWNNPIYTQTDGAVAPNPASWWQGGGNINALGFMSLDDRDNTYLSNLEPVSVTTTFQVQGTRNVEYALQLPVFASADYLGAQFLKIDINGVGVTPQTVATGYFGNKDASPAGAISSELDAYPKLSASQVYTASFVPETDGPVFFTYTFTLVAVTSAGSRQNADIVVQAPTVSNCVA